MNYTKPLVDLGQGSSDPRLEGILSPHCDPGEVKKYMSDHYGSEAGVRSQTFDMTGAYKAHLLEAAERAAWTSRLREVRHALDICCGFGSATIPLLELCPQAEVVATDFSIHMLVALKDRLKGRADGERCRFMQLNAEQLDFEDGAFDLVVGAAALHHLFHPERVIEQSFRLLGPGGLAVFFEPFEVGMNIVSLIYQSFQRHWRFRFLDPKVKAYVSGCVGAWRSMSTKPKSDPFFAGVDDKWVFARSFIEDHARRSGFERVLVYSLTKSERPFEEMVANHFSGNGMPAPAPWMMEIADAFEKTFSADAKRDLMTEGAIVLMKFDAS